MSLYYIPAKTIFTLYKTLGLDLQTIPPLVRDYFFQLQDDWFFSNSYFNMEKLVIGTAEDTANLQALVALTKKQPDMLMLVLLSTLLQEKSHLWPFETPTKTPPSNVIKITFVQFNAKELNTKYHCVLNNQHTAITVPLKEWYHHLLNILSYRSWLGFCETAQLSKPNNDNSIVLEKALFYVDGVALAWDQWCYLENKAFSIQEKPVINTPCINTKSLIDAYQTKRKEQLTHYCVTTFNKQLKQAWLTYENSSTDFSNEVRHLENDLELDDRILNQAKTTIDNVNKTMVLIRQQMEILDNSITSTKQNILEKISFLQPIYEQENEKLMYFFSNRALNNQAKQQERQKKALFALGLQQLTSPTAISYTDKPIKIIDTYHHQAEVDSYNKLHNFFEQITMTKESIDRTLDNTLKQTPLKYPLEANELFLKDLLVSIEIDGDSGSDEYFPQEPSSIAEYYTIFNNGYKTLEEQWQERQVCFEAQQRCLPNNERCNKSKLDISAETLQYLKKQIANLRQSASQIKTSLTTALENYSLFNQSWQSKTYIMRQEIEALNTLIYSPEKNAQGIPQSLSNLTTSCNDFLNQSALWGKNNNDYKKCIAQYDLKNSHTIDTIKNHGNGQLDELSAIQTLLHHVKKALQTLDSSQSWTTSFFNFHKKSPPKKSWDVLLNEAYTNFKNTYHNGNTFTLSESTSALLEMYFENESNNLLKLLDEKTSGKKQNEYLINFWQLIMISAIIPNDKNYLLTTTPHHRYYIFQQLMEKMKNTLSLPIDKDKISQYIYVPQSNNLFETSCTSIKELPEPFNGDYFSINLSKEQQKNLGNIRQSTKPQEIMAWLYIDEVGKNIFPIKSELKLYEEAHECFKGPQLMLALYYIELKIKEAAKAYHDHYQGNAWQGSLAEDFKTLIYDILHYPYWQAILQDETDVIVLVNPSNTEETKTLTALAFIKESLDLFPTVNNAIATIPALAMENSWSVSTNDYPPTTTDSATYGASYDNLETEDGYETISGYDTKLS
ncbi:MAG: hypothetical protein ACX932_06650 [Gammaproteobacteria bacterium]